MRPKLVALLLVLAGVASLVSTACAQVADSDEALTVARNWVNLIIAKKGTWGGSPTAEVTGISELRMQLESQLLGYCCPVSPRGWVVISRYKDLASVKAYSDTGTLDLSDPKGIGAFVVDSLDGMVNSVELHLGKKISKATSKEIQGVLNTNFRSSWSLLGGDRTTGTEGAVKQTDTSRTPLTANYGGGQVLTHTIWDQCWPYNAQCPYLGCTDGRLNGYAWAGCVATAGAQVMGYWNWPPTGSNGEPYDDAYDWANMPDWIDGYSPQAVQDAISELMREVGVAVDTDYGCDGSSAYVACTYWWETATDMEDVYEGHYRYADCSAIARHNGYPWPADSYNYSADSWFNIIKEQVNQNRVINYRIKGHAIVCDGWQEVGDPAVKQYHINYGWRDDTTAWYTLDSIYQCDEGGSPKDEKMVINIRPDCALGAAIAGDYGLPAYPFRYFDMDATAAGAAWFPEGHGLQFLPNVVFRANGTADQVVFVDGSLTSPTRLFSHGDQTRGMRINGQNTDRATLRMSDGGSVVLR